MRRFCMVLRDVTLTACIIANAARAQIPTGAIAGRITDSTTTGLIANVTVVAVNSGGGIGGTARTNAQGVYRISGLANGTYTVEIRSIGHVPRVVSGVIVRDGVATV